MASLCKHGKKVKTKGIPAYSTRSTAQQHFVADKRLGRKWECVCVACVSVRHCSYCYGEGYPDSRL